MLWDRISGDNIDIIALLEDIDIIEEAAAAAEDINVCPVTQHTLHSLSDLSHPTWPGPMSRSLSAIIMDPTLKPDNVPDWLRGT